MSLLGMESTRPSRRFRRRIATVLFVAVIITMPSIESYVPLVPTRARIGRLPASHLIPSKRVRFALQLPNAASMYISDGASSSNSTAVDPTNIVKKELKWRRVLVPKAPPPVHLHERMSTADKCILAATGLTAIGSLAYLIHWSGPGAWRYYLAGGICAAASHAIPVPIDVVKTRKQVDPKLYRLSFIDATHEIIQNEGSLALLAGLGPTVFGYMLEGAIKFGVYEMMKPIMSNLLFSAATLAPPLAFLHSSQLCGFVTAAMISGVAASIMLCPMEALRIRLVSERDFAPNGWIQGGYRMIQYEGVFALWKGLLPMILKQVPYTVTKNVSFDYMTRFGYVAVAHQGLGVGAWTKLVVPLGSALVASVLSCVTSQPGDLLLSIVNAHEGNRTTKSIVKDILRSTRGVKGFFMGMKPRFLHVGIIVTLQLLIYDFVKRLCGIAATGTV